MTNKEIRQKTYRMIARGGGFIFGCFALYGALTVIFPRLLNMLPGPKFVWGLLYLLIAVLLYPITSAVCFRIPMMLWRDEQPVFRDVFHFYTSWDKWLGAVRFGAPFIVGYNIILWILRKADSLQKDWLNGIAAGVTEDIVSGSTVNLVDVLSQSSALQENSQLAAISVLLSIVIFVLRAAAFVFLFRIRTGADYLFAEGMCTEPAEGARRSFDMMRGWFIRYMWLQFSAQFWAALVVIAVFTVLRMIFGAGVMWNYMIMFGSIIVLPFMYIAPAGLMKDMLYTKKMLKQLKKERKMKASSY